MARKLMRASARRLLAGADALSGREKYPFPIFLRPLLAENAAVRDAHRGRRCFVIGNGPSLARQDIESLAGELTFAMNGFLNHPAIRRVKPAYYCLVDPSYFDGSASSDRFLGRLFETVTDSHFILPYASAETILCRWKVPPGRATFVTFAGNLATTSLRRIDPTRPLPGVLNCAQLAIMIALYAGCSPVYLMGMDHDWAAHRGTETHFYPQKTIENHPVAHGEWDRYPYLTILDDCLKVWRGYVTLRRRAESLGLSIVNCSDGGFLDVFDRADYHDVVNTRSAPSPNVQAAA